MYTTCAINYNMERKTKSTPEIITIESDTDNDLDIIVISSDSEDDVKEMKQQSERKRKKEVKAEGRIRFGPYARDLLYHAIPSYINMLEEKKLNKRGDWTKRDEEWLLIRKINLRKAYADLGRSNLVGDEVSICMLCHSYQ